MQWENQRLLQPLKISFKAARLLSTAALSKFIFAFLLHAGIRTFVVQRHSFSRNTCQSMLTSFDSADWVKLENVREQRGKKKYALYFRNMELPISLLLLWRKYRWRRESPAIAALVELPQ